VRIAAPARWSRPHVVHGRSAAASGVLFFHLANLRARPSLLVEFRYTMSGIFVRGGAFWRLPWRSTGHSGRLLPSILRKCGGHAHRLIRPNSSFAASSRVVPRTRLGIPSCVRVALSRSAPGWGEDVKIPPGFVFGHLVPIKRRGTRASGMAVRSTAEQVVRSLAFCVVVQETTRGVLLSTICNCPAHGRRRVHRNAINASERRSAHFAEVQEVRSHMHMHSTGSRWSWARREAELFEHCFTSTREPCRTSVQPTPDLDRDRPATRPGGQVGGTDRVRMQLDAAQYTIQAKPIPHRRPDLFGGAAGREDSVTVPQSSTGPITLCAFLIKKRFSASAPFTKPLSTMGALPDTSKRSRCDGQVNNAANVELRQLRLPG